MTRGGEGGDEGGGTHLTFGVTKLVMVLMVYLIVNMSCKAVQRRSQFGSVFSSCDSIFFLVCFLTHIQCSYRLYF